MILGQSQPHRITSAGACSTVSLGQEGKCQARRVHCFCIPVMFLLLHLCSYRSPHTHTVLRFFPCLFIFDTIFSLISNYSLIMSHLLKPFFSYPSLKFFIFHLLFFHSSSVSLVSVVGALQVQRGIILSQCLPVSLLQSFVLYTCVMLLSGLLERWAGTAFLGEYFMFNLQFLL